MGVEERVAVADSKNRARVLSVTGSAEGLDRAAGDRTKD
jgi:hypothetical protein